MDSPKSRCEILLAQILPIVEQLLSRNGEFYPVGGGLRSDGKVDHLMPFDGRSMPPSDDLIEQLASTLRDGAANAQFEATAIIFDAKVTHPQTGKQTDAIIAELEHRDNFIATVVHPYHREGGSLTFASGYALEAGRGIFIRGR